MAIAVKELQLAQKLDSNGEKYRQVQANTLLMGGSKSPDFLREVLPILASKILQARLIEFPGFDHNAPDLYQPDTIAKTLRQFFKEA